MSDLFNVINDHDLSECFTSDNSNSTMCSNEGPFEDSNKQTILANVNPSLRDMENVNKMTGNKMAATCSKMLKKPQTIYKKTEDVVETNGVSSTDCANKKNEATVTEYEDDTTSKCKYCKARTSKLRLLERIKAKKSLNRLSYHSSKSFLRRKHVSVNKSCQTSPGLFEMAKMTEEEHQSLAMILRLRSGRTDRNETFCKCLLHGKEKDCHCGESDTSSEWVWDATHRSQATDILDDGCLVIFHKDFSCGTAAVRGKQAMRNDQYFWEIKMTTPVYGTDMMIGVGTDTIDLSSSSNTFCSMLGNDVDSWGISYDGRVQHGGQKQEYCSQFGQGAIIGVHLDMWHGKIAFYKNRQALGTAYSGLQGRTLYPMACSTAARSGMKIISSSSFPSSLQFMCSYKLRQHVPAHLNVLDVLEMPPGLRLYLSNKMSWLLNAMRPQPKNLLSPSVICHICLPLKGVLEGLTDYEDSDEEEPRDIHLLIPSENESSDDNEDEDNDISYFDASRLMRNHHSGEYSEGRSPKSDDAAEDSETYPFGFKRLKCDGGRSHIVYTGKEDERERSDEIKKVDGTPDMDEMEEDLNMDQQSADAQEKIILPRKRKRSQ